jgi:hypothetical protein
MTIHDPEPTSEAAAHHYNVDTYYRAINLDDRAAFRGTGLRVGHPAPSFRLESVDGDMVDLDQLRATSHVGLVFGSYSAPPVILGMPAIDELYASLPPTATIVFVYTREIHPNQEMPPTHRMHLPHHQTMEQKLAQAQQFRDEMKLRLPVLVDDLAGTVHRAYGCLPFSAAAVHRNGTLVHRQEWASADLLGAVMNNLLEGDRRREAGAPGRSSYAETIWNSERTVR